MSGTPNTYTWRPGQVLRLAASLLLALAKVIERLNPATSLELVTSQTELLGERLYAALSNMTLSLLPLFANVFDESLQVIEDGAPVDEDGSWVEEFFAKITLACVHTDGKECLTSKELVKRIRARMNGRREFDQHVLDWLFRHWSDPRIPIWFKEAVKKGDIYVVTTRTILRNHVGNRCVLYLYWRNGRLYWLCRWLSSGNWDRRFRGLVSSDS